MHRRALVFAAAFALVAAPLHAQLTEKQAAAKLKQVGKQLTGSFKSAMSDALAELDATLDLVDAQAASTDMPDLADQVFDALAQWMATLEDARFGAVAETGIFGSGELADLEPPAVPGALPAGFAAGDGGAWDGFRASLDKAIAKARSAALKRVAKTRAKLEQQGGILMQVVLAPDGAEFAWLAAAGPSFSQQHELTVDVAVAASLADEAEDGYLEAGGAATDPMLAGQIDVDVLAASGSLGPVLGAAWNGGRWTAAFGGLVEGGVLVSAQNDVALAKASIGLR